MWYCGEFIAALRSQGLHERTISNYRRFTRRLIDFCMQDGMKTCRQVSDNDVQRYLETEVHASDFTPGWKYVNVLYLRRYFQFLVEENIIFAPPKIHCKNPVFRSGSYKPVEEGALRRILDQYPSETDADILIKAILETAYSSALRSSEIRSLKIEDISFSTGTLFLEQAKGKKDRVVPVGKTALWWLKRYITEIRLQYLADPDDTHVFVGLRTGKAFRHRALAEFIKIRLRSHELPHLNIHQLRASAATHMVNAGMKIGYAQHLLGHQQLTTTERYVRIRRDELKRRLAHAHPREAMGKRISI